METIIVIPANRETAFRNAFTNERVERQRGSNLFEAVGVMVPNIDGTKLMCGTQRISRDKRDHWRGRKPPWLEIYNSYEDLMASGWQFGEGL